MQIRITLRRYVLTAMGTAIAVLSPHISHAQSTGSISGSILDSSGPIKGSAWVTAIRTTLPPARATAAIDARGAFLVTDLPPGNYRLCVQVPDGSYLDPCQWAGPADPVKKEVTVQAGQVATGVQVILEAASKLRIHLNDPSDLLESGRPERDIMVGVFTPNGLFSPAPVRSRAAKTRVHEVSIPFDKPIKVHVASGKLNLSDSQGSAVAANGKTVSVSAAKGGPDPQPIVYTVTGLKQ